MNRLPSGTIHAPSIRKPNLRRRGRTPRVHPSSHSAILPSWIVYIRSCEIVGTRIPQQTMTAPHEDSGTPQFAQNAAVVGLGKPHREQFVVPEAEGAVASG